MKNMKSPDTKKKFSLSQSLFTGCVASCAEVLVNHPLLTIKIQLQSYENALKSQPVKWYQKIDWRPNMLYKGIGLNFCSMVPAVTVQVTSSYFLQSKIFQNDDPKSRAISAFFGGCVSGLVASPTELILTQQQKSKQPFKQALSNYLQKRGYNALYTGFMATALRNGLFTLGYFGAYPYIKDTLKDNLTTDEVVASAIAGVTSGLLSAIPSHLFDTPKTHQQKFADLEHIRFMNSAKAIYAENGVKGLFKGVVPRSLKIISATIIMGTITRELESVLGADNVDSQKQSLVKSLKK